MCVSYFGSRFLLCKVRALALLASKEALSHLASRRRCRPGEPSRIHAPKHMCATSITCRQPEAAERRTETPRGKFPRPGHKELRTVPHAREGRIEKRNEKPAKYFNAPTASAQPPPQLLCPLLLALHILQRYVALAQRPDYRHTTMSAHKGGLFKEAKASAQTRNTTGICPPKKLKPVQENIALQYIPPLGVYTVEVITTHHTNPPSPCNTTFVETYRIVHDFRPLEHPARRNENVPTRHVAMGVSSRKYSTRSGRATRRRQGNTRQLPTPSPRTTPPFVYTQMVRWAGPG